MSIPGFTPLHIESCLLSPFRIDLWQFSLAQDSSRARILLNEEERASADRFHFPRHQRRFTNARGLLRILLGRYLHTSPEKLAFIYNAHGKPQVVNAHKLHFNLSHSGDLALLAVGKDMPMGVDIECYSTRPFDGIAHNLFSSTELAEFKKVPALLKPAVFFHIWAQKEAFIKACGLGLAYPTKEFTVPTTLPSRQMVYDALHNTSWKLRSFMPQIACSGALCHHPTVREIRYGLLPSQETTRLKFD